MARLLVPLLAACTAAAQELLLDRSKQDQPFYGVGGLSGGGATSRLLVDYKEPQRSEILDLLFKPNYGASLQILKVEIGGDSQSTDGTEPSHMHSEDDLDYHRGYEWWLLSEAKKRNPEIKTYGLPWAFPGWVGGKEHSGNPFKHPELTSKYLLKWLQGAREVYGVEVDYIGIWNERSSDATYAKTLRKTLDAAGFGNTTLVAKDGDADICNEMAKDKGYVDAIGVVGLHYPTDYADYSHCRALGYGVKGGKPIWSSEESSSYDDLNGAACWARVIASHYVLQGFTSSIMWNLVGAYYHGTEWFASSMMTAVEPWSGHYEALEVVWATAHVTQFTKVGWQLLEVGGGSGQLPKGGFYTTYVDPAGEDWSMVIVKIDRDHASCTRPPLPRFEVGKETVQVRLARGTKGGRLAVWYSNFQETDGAGKALKVFERLADVEVKEGGLLELEVPVGAVYTVSTVLEGRKTGPYPRPPASAPSFPLPYFDDFEGVAESQEGRLWADQIGAFEVHKNAEGRKAMRQMVPALPIGWNDGGSRGPVSLLGMREWQDVEVSAVYELASEDKAAAACIGARVDQMWHNGIVLCVAPGSGNWSLGVGGPKLKKPPQADYARGSLGPLPAGGNLTLVTVGDRAWGYLQPTAGKRTTLFANAQIRDLDTGFAAIGASGWLPVEFDTLSVRAVGSNWHPTSPCPLPQPGAALHLRACAANGVAVQDQAFELDATWAIRHVATGLCASAAGKAVVLAQCNATDARQQFRNDYTRIRNTDEKIHSGKGLLMGSVAERTVFVPEGEVDGAFQSWSYFPNTKQLRNQYTANLGLGYPMCLSSCAPEEIAYV